MNPKQLTMDISVGLLSGVMRVVSAISTATLLFPLGLSKYFLTGVTVGVITVIVPSLVSGIRNTIPYITYSRDYTPILLFSLVAAELSREVPASQFEATMIAFIVLTTVATGATFYLVGRFRLSNLARFVPFPVVAGFLGGVALLIIQQGLGTLAGFALTPANLVRFLSPGVVLHWLPGVVFALVMVFGGRYIKTNYFRQLVILATVAIFIGVLAATHTSVHDAFIHGWSARSVDGRLPFGLYALATFRTETIVTVLPHLNLLLTIVGVSLLSLLITLAGLEVATRQDMTFERELRDAGIANIAGGLLGGSISYQSVSNSMVNYKMGGRSRLVPILTGAVALVFLVFGWGTGAIAYLPLALLSGLVLYAGLDSAKSWLIDSRRRMTSVEYGVLITIAVAIVIWGVLVGVTVGIVIAVLLFTINYSQLKCIELRQTGKSLRSKVERPSMEEEILRRFDDQLRLFRLQGYLFFGSAEKIGETVVSEIRHHHREGNSPLYVMLDFRSVSGVDSSATLAFSRIFEVAGALGAHIMLIHMQDQVAAIMARSIEGFDSSCVYPDLDIALESREVAILSAIQPHERRPHSAAETLRQYLMIEEDVKALEAFFDVQSIEKGEILFRAGAAANSMMIVDAGEFEVYREGYGGEIIRLRKVMAGAILGEMGIYLRGHRTASVRAIVDSRVFVLDDTGLALMHETAPDLALKFNRFVIGVLAARLSHSNNEVLELSSN